MLYIHLLETADILGGQQITDNITLVLNGQQITDNITMVLSGQQTADNR